MATLSVKPDQRPAKDRDGNERPNLSRCEFRTEKKRRCLLVSGHEGDHAMVLRSEITPPKTLAELRKDNADAFKGFKLTAEIVPDAEEIRREYKREAGPRDADQVKVDADAKRAYDAWVKAGSPAFRSIPDAPKGKFVFRYIIPPPAFDTVIMMLRRSTQTGGPVNGKRLAYTRAQHESGNVMVYYAVTDPRSDGNGDSK